MDTNVIIDVASVFPGATTRGNAYIDCVFGAERNGAKLFVSTLSFYEAAGIIERVVVKSTLGYEPTREDIKRQRANPQLRKTCVDRLRRFWNQVVAFAEPLDASVASDSIPNSLELLERTRLDGYDPLILLAARQHRISTIVTHDADFATVPDLIVVTANDAMLV